MIPVVRAPRGTFLYDTGFLIAVVAVAGPVGAPA